MGREALTRNQTGNDNTALGTASMFFNQTGELNTAAGAASLRDNTEGNENVSVGHSSLLLNATGSQNTAVGVNALINNQTGAGNIAVGHRAGEDNNDGSDNIFIGARGNPGDNATIRLGRSVTHNRVFVHGIFNSSFQGEPVVVNAAGRLGVTNALSADTLQANVNVIAPNAQISSIQFLGSIVPDITTGRVDVQGELETDALHITAGSDLSERFEVRSSDGQPAVPGAVLSIDPDTTGSLRITTTAYDRTVAGVVSGAGGVSPGMLMGQVGSIADGNVPVALTGRVYVLADATAGAIEPGDLLTSSSAAGHAMKVQDLERAQGAILGKAMSRLSEGRGLVLALISLQ